MERIYLKKIKSAPVDKMSEMNFRREIVKKCIAQMCINIGWEGITANALDTLTNILENYFFSVAHHTHLASEISECFFNGLEVLLNTSSVQIIKFCIVKLTYILFRSVNFQL